jgi:hypothetical protein
MEAHPAAELFPLLTGKEFDSFKADIAQHGVREAIWLCDGKILDGRNRYRACTELNIDPHFVEYTGDSPTAFVWSLNGIRRHLTKSQRAAIAVEMLPHLETEAKERQGERTDIMPISAEGSGVSVEIAGDQVGIGKTMVQKAKQVKKSDEALFEKVKSGEVQLEDAHRQIKDGEPIPDKPRALPNEQRAVQIRALAYEGNRADQIASEIGISVQQVRKLARQHNITLPDAALGKVHKVDVYRVIETTVHGLEGYAQGLQTVNGNIVQIDADIALTWAESLRSSLSPIQKLRKQLLEVANGN